MDTIEKTKLQKWIKNNTNLMFKQDKFECECGVKLCISSIKRHLTTDKHIMSLKAKKYNELVNTLNQSSTNS
tara:strand:+ start:3038 stop:3253 length:216 start_codon:yes stop_codon:yes gene_type:complete